LARLRPDGNMDFLGRNDGQVKVRGFRIELGEIEAALASHPAVAQCVAMVREDRPGDVRLVSYLVPKKGEDFTDTELRKHLRKTLPEYMLPQHFVEQQAFPLTPNGKVDRKALPPPFHVGRAEDEHVEARSESEKLLAGIWREVLGAPKVSVHDNFFNLGGHSLLCLQVIAQVERVTGKRLSPRVILLNSLEQIAAQLGWEPKPGEKAEAAKPAAASPAADEKKAPLPFAQRMLQKLKRGSPSDS
jgi:hypothetical protein